MSDIFGLKQTGTLKSRFKPYIAMVSTAIAPVAALPTTAAHMAIWNGEATKKYIIHAFGTIITTSAGAAINLGIAAHLSTVKVLTVPTGTANSNQRSLYTGTGYDGAAGILRAATITNDGVWHTCGDPIICANTANVMMNKHYEADSRYVVYPGMVFSLASLCNAAGAAVCTPYVIWSEVDVDQSNLAG